LTHSPSNSITHLDIYNHGIHARGVYALTCCIKKSLHSLSTLVLGDNNIGDRGATILATTLTSPNIIISELILYNCQIGDQGAISFSRALRANPPLRSLLVWGNKIGDKGIKAISECLGVNTILRVLSISRNQFGIEGMQDLCNALSINQSLQTLEIDGNLAIRDEGGRFLVDMIIKTTSLTSLEVGNCGFGIKGCERICEAVSKNTSLLCISLTKYELNENCFSSLRSAKYLLEFEFTIDGNFQKQTQIQYWEERVKWSCVLNGKSRTLLLGGECNIFPLEMIHYILESIVPFGVMSQEKIREIIRFSTNKSTLGTKKREFLRRVFGGGLGCDSIWTAIKNRK